MEWMTNLKWKCQKPLFCKSFLLIGPYYDVTISGKQWFIEWSDWYKFGTVGFLFQRAFKKHKIDRLKMMSVAL